MTTDLDSPHPHAPRRPDGMRAEEDSTEQAKTGAGHEGTLEGGRDDPARPRQGRSLRVDPAWVRMPLLREWGWIERRATGQLLEHANDGYEITFATEGEVHWEVVGGPELRLGGGHVCLTQPRVRHHGVRDRFAPVTLFWLVLDPGAPHAERSTPFSRAELRALDLRLGAVGNRVARAHPSLAPLFEQLRVAMERVTAIRPEACLEHHAPATAPRTAAAPYAAPDAVRYAGAWAGAPLDPEREEDWLRPWTRCLLSQILVATLRSYEEPTPNPAPPAIQRACRILEACFAEPVEMSRLARQVGMARSAFYAAFRDATGLTPVDYLNRVRCRRASALLAGTDRSVTEIALACGFSTSQYFARCYRKYMAMTPSQYRASAQGG